MSFSAHEIASYLRTQGYLVVACDYQPWRGWSWIDARLPGGQLVRYKGKNLGLRGRGLGPAGG